MAGSTQLLARRSLRARLGRTIAISFAVLAGVSFVSGSFVLADSLGRSFDQLITELVQGIDVQVRSEAAFDNDDFGGDDTRPPIPVELVDVVAGVEGVAIAEPDFEGRAQILDPDGEPIASAGGPTFGVVWSGEDGLTSVTLKEGREPAGPGDVALDKATADRAGFEIGDTISYVTDTGTHEATLVGTIGLSDSDSFVGASVVVLDIETGLDRYDTQGLVETINIGLAEGADADAVSAAVLDVLPPGLETITSEELIEETQDEVGEFISVFGNGLLGFAFVTAFVAAFIINNVFQITIGQRLRELALMRAIGASGTQVKRLIRIEALLVGIIGTVLGVLAGLLVARLIVAAFNAAGAGFPTPDLVLLPRTVIVAAIVGIGVTMLSVIVPARRAAKIPPLAAMRPDIGYTAIRSRRLVAGVVLSSIGVLMLLGGLFLASGTSAIIGLAAIGALLLFLGVASLSATVASPVSRFIGWPIAKVFKTPGRLAQDNVSRTPRRTASSAAALMIGVALVSAAAVFASSLRNSISATFDRAINADYVVQSEGGGGPGDGGFPPVVVDTLAALPEIEAATPFRIAFAQIDGDVKTLSAVDPVAAEQLVEFDVVDGDLSEIEVTSLAVHDEAAESAGLAFGDDVDVTFENGETRTLQVDVVFSDNSFGLNWFIGLDLHEEVTAGTQDDLFALARLADGVDAADGDRAVEDATAEFTQVNVQSNAEFLQEQEDQINQLLLVISFLLLFAIVIAVIGISITLALGVFERTREIGLLRAVGMSRRQTRRSVRWEAVIVSLFGAVVGIVLGTFLGAVLSIAVPDNIISELAFSPLIIVGILVGAVAA
ncbi:MAG: FtsX-like permease family protein, partial [Actinomycetota bacterium]